MLTSIAASSSLRTPVNAVKQASQKLHRPPFKGMIRKKKLALRQSVILNIKNFLGHILIPIQFLSPARNSKRFMQIMEVFDSGLDSFRWHLKVIYQ